MIPDKDDESHTCDTPPPPTDLDAWTCPECGQMYERMDPADLHDFPGVDKRLRRSVTDGSLVIWRGVGRAHQ
jgi:hypothetical protein